MPNDTTIKKIGLNNEFDYDKVDTMVGGHIGDMVGSAFSRRSDDGTNPNEENGLGELIQASSIAAGHRLSNKVVDDRFLLQHGTYILNQWGYGRRFEIDCGMNGPFSTRLSDEFMASDRPSELRAIPESAVEKLSEILGRGEKYACAYVTILALLEWGHKKDDPKTVRVAMDLEPGLEQEVMEAAECLLA